LLGELLEEGLGVELGLSLEEELHDWLLDSCWATYARRCAGTLAA
jgi:hypothetical protein